jgi:phosphoglycerate kinase
MFMMPGGWLLIDMPGLREVQLWASPEQLDAGFDDLRELAQGCRFRDCTHSGEPGCAVTASGIDGGRLENYHKMQRELDYLGKALTDPERPFVAILGGAKISGKIDVIEQLLPRVDALLVGGAMACTFYKAMGLETGRSLVEEDRVEMARDLLSRSGTRMILPHDAVVANSLEDASSAHGVARDGVKPHEAIFDIGPATVALYCEQIAGARTVFWNGPMGVFERKPFENGTLGIARCVADASAYTVVGGGDSLAAIEAAGVGERIDHISTGGGASLEYLEGRDLPGIAALPDA